jgi:hypothetical protein
MSANYREELKEEICTQLLIGKGNGEAELETMARIVWLERRVHATREPIMVDHSYRVPLKSQTVHHVMPQRYNAMVTTWCS